MNKVIFMGRLTRDPEVRYSQGNNSMAIANFSLAVDRRFKREGEPDADFFNCTAFGRQAEFVERYLFKGTKVLLTGRVQNNNYTDRDGRTVYGTRIVVEELEFAESKNSQSGQGSGFNGNQQSQGFGNTDSDGFMNIPDGIDEELPFN